MNTKKIVVRGGGENLYEVRETYAEFYAYKIDVGLLWNSEKYLGKTRRFDAALALIRAHSGREILNIS